MYLAQIIGIPSPATRFQNHETLVGDLLSRFLIYAIALAGLFFMVRFLLAAYSFITSTAEPAKVQSAQQQMLYAIIGLLIVIGAFFILQAMQYVLGINITF